MAAAVWKGYIGFGLVSIPVRLFTGARAKSVSFHLLHKTDNSRVHEVLYCNAENKPVRRADLVKGYEYRKDKYVVVTLEEIKKATPRTASVMEVLEFVRADDIDPIFFETSYYIAPDENGQKPYALLLEALRQTNYDGLAKVTMHGRENIVILRPAKRGLMLHTMYYSDEVRNIAEFHPNRTAINDKELKLAKTLIDSLAGDFHPEKYKDTYRENLARLIQAKAKGKDVKPAPEPKAAKVVDIMEALQKSLEGKKAAPRERSKKRAHRKSA